MSKEKTAKKEAPKEDLIKTSEEAKMAEFIEKITALQKEYNFELYAQNTPQIFIKPILSNESN